MGQKARLRDDNEALRARLAELEGLAQGHDLLEAEVAASHRAADIAQAEADAARAEADAARAEADAARAEAAAAWAEADTMRADALAARAHTDTLRPEADAARAEAREARDVAEAMRRDLDSARQGLEDARRALETTRLELDTALAHLAAACQEGETARTELAAARAEVSAARQDADAARTEADAALREVAAARLEADVARELAEARREDAAVDRATLGQAETPVADDSSMNVIVGASGVLMEVDLDPSDAGPTNGIGHHEADQAVMVAVARGTLDVVLMDDPSTDPDEAGRIPPAGSGEQAGEDEDEAEVDGHDLTDGSDQVSPVAQGGTLTAGPGQDLEDVLRSVGALLDRRRADDVVITETDLGIIVRARIAGGPAGRTPHGASPVDRRLSRDDLRALRQDAVGRRGTGHQAGPLERSLRAVGRVARERGLQRVTIMQHRSSGGWLLWHSANADGQPILLALAPAELEQVVRAATPSRRNDGSGGGDADRSDREALTGSEGDGEAIKEEAVTALASSAAA